MANRNHLVVFLDDFTMGGAQRRMLTLAHAFAVAGYRVDLVVIRAQGLLRAEVSPLVRVVVLNPRAARLPWVKQRKGRWALTGLPALVRYLRHERPEVLLSTSPAPNIVALWARSLAGISTRVVVRVDNLLSRITQKHTLQTRGFRCWSARHFYRRADAIIAVSHGIAEDVVRVTGLPRERITTIYNPILTAELQDKAREPLKHPWFILGTPPVLLAVGRLVAQKDFATLLRAFARVRAVRPVRLCILGEGEERVGLERLVRTLGVANDVALPGFVLNPFPYMVRASVLVLSSAWEGLPGVLIEALACGCPVVSTDCPSGPAEILDKGVYGSLSPVGDDAALASAISAVLDRPPDRERLRTRATQFSVERATEYYLQVMLGNSTPRAETELETLRSAL